MALPQQLSQLSDPSRPYLNINAQPQPRRNTYYPLARGATKFPCLFTANPIHRAKTSQLKSTRKDLGGERLKQEGGTSVHVSTSMWWTELRSAIGQRFNLEGIVFFAKVTTQNPELAVPHVSVPDIRWIDWLELRKRGFRGVVFDKDNTITVPYVLSLWAPLKPSVESCKAVFGDDNVAVFSNSAGLLEFDPDGSKARALEGAVGIKVIRHRVKKPAGNAEEIEKHFGCSSSTLVMVGDRHFTDIVYGNQNGFLTILTQPLSRADEPFIVRLVRKIEELVAHRLYVKGLKPKVHSSGLQDHQVVCRKDLTL